MGLTRRVAMAGVSATMMAGAVLAGGSSAMAATTVSPAAGRLPAQSAAADGPRSDRHRDSQRPADRWIEDQLATFYPSYTHRPAAFDPWVRDQVATFFPAGR
ncbi:hypothetical protein ACF073_36565 [Streptomyces sp. NPDC015171]|uniref:hypothetical protein n=1 Tax=Streptomyces sp. NPDC015171 TaxID=3364945 RepID=UPI0036F6D59B